MDIILPGEHPEFSMPRTPQDYGFLQGEGGANIGFTPAEFAMLAYPMRDPKKPIWKRQNGALGLVLQQAAIVDDKTGEVTLQMPFGKIPRNIMVWLASEVRRTGEQVVDVGANMQEFLQKISGEQHPGGSRRAAAKRQMKAVFSAPTTITRRTDQGMIRWNFQVTKGEYTLFMPSKGNDDPVLFGSKVKLGDDFYESLIQSGFPIDLDAYALLNQTKSPLALDIYVWLCHRLYCLAKETVVTWAQLQLQFGTTTQQAWKFKQTFLEALERVKIVYPDARVEPTKKGLRLRYSKPAVPPKKGSDAEAALKLAQAVILEGRDLYEAQGAQK